MTRARRIALCAVCGHSWKNHSTPTSECVAVVAWVDFHCVYWNRVLCSCGVFRYRQSGRRYDWLRLFEAESMLLIEDDVIECPFPECGAACSQSDVSDEGCCQYCGGNITSLLANAV